MTGRNKRNRKRTTSNTQKASDPVPPTQTDDLLKSLSSITIQPYDGTLSPSSTLSPTFSACESGGTPATSPSSSPPVLLTAVEVAEKNIDDSLYLLDATTTLEAPPLRRGMTCFLSNSPPQTLVANTIHLHDPRAPFPEPLKQGFIQWATGQPRPRNAAENTYNNRTMRFWRMATDFDRFQSGDDEKDDAKKRKPNDPPKAPETWWTSPQRPYTAPPHQMWTPPPPPAQPTPQLHQGRRNKIETEKVSPYASRHRY